MNFRNRTYTCTHKFIFARKQSSKKSSRSIVAMCIKILQKYDMTNSDVILSIFPFLADFLTLQLLIFPTKPNFLGTEQIFIECYKLHWRRYLKSSFESTAIWVSKIAESKTQGASGSLDTGTIKRALTIAVASAINVLRGERNLKFQTAHCNCKKDCIDGFYKYSCIYSMFTSSTDETCPLVWKKFFHFSSYWCKAT